jgi:LacI family transcriptional regulator
MGTNTAPTLHDVARRAGVSTATVSRCLNLPDCVRPQTRARVKAAVAELGYTPHFGGRALVSNRTNTVGAVIPTMENAIFARGLQAMQDEFSAGGVTLLVATSYYDAEREAEQIRALLARGVDGLVLIGKARPDSTYQMLQARNIPFLLCKGDGGTGAHQRSPSDRDDLRPHLRQRPRRRTRGGRKGSAGREGHFA